MRQINSTQQPEEKGEIIKELEDKENKRELQD